MAGLPLPNAGTGFVKQGEVLTPLQINQALWRAQQMIVEMTNVMDVERRERVRQQDLVQVLNERVERQGSQLQQYEAVLQSQVQVQDQASPSPQSVPIYGVNSSEAGSQLLRETVQPVEVAPTLAPDVQQASVSLPRLSPVKLEMPKPFSNKKEKEVSDWIFQMTLFFSASYQEESQWGLRAAMNLGGEVLTWYRSLGHDPRSLSWGDLSQVLLQAFRSPDFDVRARDQLESCRQSSSVAGYVAPFRQALVKCVNVGHEESLHCFVRGLKQECRAYVRLQGPQNLQQAYQTVDRYESSQENPDRKGMLEQRKQGDKLYDKGKWFKKGSPSAEGKQPYKTNGKDKKKFSGNCFVCSKPGHRAQDCYKRVQALEAKGKANVAETAPSSEN